MTLVEFVIHLLTAHSHVLQRLAAFFGEEKLLELLEELSNPSDGSHPTPIPPPFHYEKNWFSRAPLQLAKTSPYTELEGSVRELNLSSVLEFHLWAYPFYRQWIESALDLKMTIHPTPGGEVIVQETLAQARWWINQLPVHPSLAEQVRVLGMAPWLRFQSDVTKQLGKRPLHSI